MARVQWLLGCITTILLTAVSAAPVSGQEAEWIWSPEHEKEAVPTRIACHFRKTFVLRAPDEGQIIIAADDLYQVYVNGRRVGTGQSSRELDEYDISRFLTRGRNTVAVRVENRRGSTAALAARVMVKEDNADWRSFSTDTTWRTNLNPLPLWNTAIYNDRRWATAQAFGQLGDTAPWDIEEGLATADRHNAERFQISNEFDVTRVLDTDVTGSLIAMTFNEFGQIIASRDGGPLILIYDSNSDGELDRVRTICEKVTSCQGILSLNGEVYVTGSGPDGQALYRLADKNRDGKLESVRTLLKFEGSMGEHGVHGITLGPDGLLYIVVGNHTKPAVDYDVASPVRHYYEGDLIKRYEDPGGHARGVKAPGGVVIRTDIEGRAVQLVASGLRNAYDLAFNAEGELFTYDSDMESDIGSTWYRPTHIYHIPSGAEFGWRSGWAKWPEYFVDSIPPIGDTGRGSPTGVTVYSHVSFPERFHNALFLADWSEGRILVSRLKRNGSSFTVNTEVFLKGQPLNVTDLEVAPNGDLYFVTGGRGTRGGVYKVSWKGTVPAEVSQLGRGITAVIRQPQLQSAWARQKVAQLKQELGDDWSRMLTGVTQTTANPAHYRTRALDVMQLFGPTPRPDLLIELSTANSEIVRAKAADLLGMYDTDEVRDALIGLLQDPDRNVRRKACEALLRADHEPPIDSLLPILASDDRFEAWSARRLLERIEPAKWRDEVLKSKEIRVVLQGGLALMIVDPSAENTKAVVESTAQAMGDFVTDRDFIDLLRVQQVAIHRGKLPEENAAALRHLLSEEFPAGDALINRELTRLLTVLQTTSITDRFFAYLDSEVPDADKVHVALHMCFLRSDWTTENKIRLIQFLEEARLKEGGNSFPLYIMNATRDFSRRLTPVEAEQVLSNGAKWPSAALGALYSLPKQLDAAKIAELTQMDRQILEKTDESYKRLKVGVVAVLARNADEQSMAYLREIWLRDPERRQAVAMGLAQKPDGKNWSYLVRSLSILEGPAAREVLRKLLTVERAPAEIEYHRQVILCGLRLQDQGAVDAAELLQYWTGEDFVTEETTWEEAIAACQSWFHKEHPDRPEATLPVPSKNAKWSFGEVLEYLDSEEGKSASATNGREVFAKASCHKCHRFGNQGEAIGPDLTSMARRFMKKEVLQSIIFPSHVVSDQYLAKQINTEGGKTYVGIVAPGAEGELIVLQPNGEKAIILEDDVAEEKPSKISAMPKGLLDTLSLDEIADLFAYMMTPGERVAEKPSDGKQ
ncbi:MAG: HEAT repeat domain-containing protein [Pirellulaceae bacterium]|jgi:putative heme-binding domain-containing protein|nr:HEAT repeat domain-containing protein [Pirellulaceae bacterium]MDP7020623.1 HEAT repeat domain-containing protein [Pirellulaceae bacterium]